MENTGGIKAIDRRLSSVIRKLRQLTYICRRLKGLGLKIHRLGSGFGFGIQMDIPEKSRQTSLFRRLPGGLCRRFR